MAAKKTEKTSSTFFPVLSKYNMDEVKIEDKNMAERIKLLNTLEPEDRKAVIRVIDAMLTKKKILRIVSGESQTENLAQQSSM